MKKTILMMLIFTVSSLSVAFAQKCPDFSGNYIGTDEDSEQIQFKIVQKKCDSIEAYIEGKLDREFKVDGKIHILEDGSQYPYLHRTDITYWELNTLMSVSKEIQLAQDGEYPGQDVEWSKTIHKKIYNDNQGNLVIEDIIVEDTTNCKYLCDQENRTIETKTYNFTAKKI